MKGYVTCYPADNVWPINISTWLDHYITGKAISFVPLTTWQTTCSVMINTQAFGIRSLIDCHTQQGVAMWYSLSMFTKMFPAPAVSVVIQSTFALLVVCIVKPCLYALFIKLRFRNWPICQYDWGTVLIWSLWCTTNSPKLRTTSHDMGCVIHLISCSVHISFALVSISQI